MGVDVVSTKTTETAQPTNQQTILYVVLSCLPLLSLLLLSFFVLFAEGLQGVFVLFCAFKIPSEVFLYHLIIITLAHMLE